MIRSGQKGCFKIREKEAAYAERLRKWEAREKRQAKLYEKDEQREKQRKRDTQKEAKKLKHFLEDYDDERNDPKYYKYVDYELSSVGLAHRGNV